MNVALAPVWKTSQSQNLLLPDMGFLWAVPRNRRTIEKRWKRKYGSPEYVMKIFRPKQNIIVCNTCGHYHEVGVFCGKYSGIISFQVPVTIWHLFVGNCYAKIAEETKAAQQAVQEKLGLSAVDREVVLLYDGEQAPSDQVGIIFGHDCENQKHDRAKIVQKQYVFKLLNNLIIYKKKNEVA
jgi:ribosomal protein L32